MYHQLQTLDSPSVMTFSTERPQMLVPRSFKKKKKKKVPRSFIAQNAPTESCRCTIRIPWYHQNPAYTHRILFALTAWLVPFTWNKVLLDCLDPQMCCVMAVGLLDRHQGTCNRADSRFAPRQWEMALLCNDVSHWLGANLESALCKHHRSW